MIQSTENVKFLKSHYTEEEILYIISEVLSGAKIQTYYISNKTGCKSFLQLADLNQIRETHPHTARITFSYSEPGSYLPEGRLPVLGHLQYLNIQSLMADITETDKLMRDLEKTTIAIAKRRTKDYETKLLRLLFLTIEKFWLDYDSTQPPKQDYIMYWLQNEQHLTEREAIAIDKIARPDHIKDEKDRSKKGATKPTKKPQGATQ